MNRPIAISLSPNTDSKDVARAWSVLFSRSLRENTDILSEVAHLISKKFDNRFVVLNSSGRQALYDLLRVYDIGLGDEVIIQAFTCIAVPEPILWVGAKPVYADTAKDTYSIDVQDVLRKITPSTKAIIVQHTFGIPGPIEEIVKIAKEKNIIVIEDCAHAFGATLNNKALGTFADASIISFGRDKCLSSVYGGACVVKNREQMEKLRAFHNQRKQPHFIWTVQQLLHPILFSYIIPSYFTFGIGKALLVLFQRARLLSRAVEFQERSGRKPLHIEYQYDPALAQLLVLQLEKIDAMNARRKYIADRYVQELSGSKAVLPKASQSTQPSWLRFPVLVKNQKQVMFMAREKDMLLGDWYDAVLVPKGSNLIEFRYTPGACPSAEQLAQQVINLPTYPSLTDTQVSEIIALIKTYAS